MNLNKRISRYLDKCEPAISGQRGHDTTFRVACLLFNGFARSPVETLQLLTAYNQKCQPMWSEKELKHKVNQAIRVKHSKPRGHLIGKLNKQPKPIRIVSALERMANQRKELPKQTISRTVRTITFNSLCVKKENQNTYIRYSKQASEASVIPEKTPSSGLCFPCWHTFGKYMPLNSGFCPRCNWEAQHQAA